MDSIWNFMDKFIYIMIYKIFRLKLSEETYFKFSQFLKFGLVGLSNTFIFYVVYFVLFLFDVNYILANITVFFVSVINSFYWNNKCVFNERRKNRVLWKSY